MAEEMAVMKPVTATALATSKEQKVRVSRSSLINVLRRTYSVPTSLIGKEVTVYIQEWYIDVYYAGAWVERLPRLIGEQSHHINYRHVIESLLRKPGGFRRYRFREDLFPRLIFRRALGATEPMAYAAQGRHYLSADPPSGGAHTGRDVAAALETLVAQGTPWGQADVERLRQPERGGALPGSRLSTCTIMTSCSRRCFMSQHEQLRTYCKSLRLPSLSEVLVETLARAQRESWSIETCLLHLLEQEVEGRRYAGLSASCAKRSCHRARPWPSLTKAACPCAFGVSYRSWSRGIL
ncbi:MAG: hypothetical protein R3A44_14170 [Caldilineaceae bacterium]